ncbi:c-type cytochrome [Sphingopyxis sp. MWB1]|uniref:c-type cytochrome n=1 Tax=Sphingopyxis sp. MWB1 TaxID=1537715 RepID=UPI00051A40EC|nr:cytochrome c family protein [Sphingopyxis sp. MWB1]
MQRTPVFLAGLLALAGCGKAEPPPPSAPDGAPGEAAPAEPAIQPTAAMGAQVFRRCVACHTVEKGGSNGIGPNLHGVVGRPVGSHPGFSYSGAMKARGGLWDEASLDAYLEAPMKAMPGTRMAFAGIIEPADRHAVILYLKEEAQ